jgi:hypothetical protein
VLYLTRILTALTQPAMVRWHLDNWPLCSG